MVSAALLAVLLAGEQPIVAAPGAVKVEGGGGCPSPAEVVDRLAPLLPPGPVEGAARRAVLARDGRELRVELRDADGALLAHRRLGAAACADLAAAAAVVIATWEVELRGRGVLGLWPESPPPHVPAPAEAVVIAPPPPPPPASRFELALGAAAIGATAAAGGVAPGLMIEARGGRPGARWGGSLGLLFEGDRSLSLEGGSVAWRRTALLAGVGARWPSRSGLVALEVDAALVGAVLALRGNGFTRDDAPASLDGGGALVARLSVRARSLRPWAGAGVQLWPITHEAALQGPPGAAAASRDLPRGEVFLALGLALEVRP